LFLLLMVDKNKLFVCCGKTMLHYVFVCGVCVE